VAEEQEKKRGFFNLKLMVVGLVLMIAGGALSFGLSTYFFSNSDALAKKETKGVTSGPLVKLGDFTVNIANPEGRRFLKTEIHMEVKDAETQKNIELKMPIIQDKVLSVLSSKTLSDLEVYNRDNLKQELLNQINSGLGGDNPIQNIYFTVFIMQ
jgi:flagellar FliL protein